MRKTSQKTINDAILLLQKGYSCGQVAKKLPIGLTTVSKIRNMYCSDLEKHKGGRPRLFTERAERRIVRQITSGEHDTAAAVHRELVKEKGMQLNVKTVKRALRRAGLKAIVKVKKPTLSRKHRRDRLEFAHKYKSWTVKDWKRVIWSDETKINLWGSDGRKWCWKTPGAALQPHNVQLTLKNGGGSIMIWGCMTAKGLGNMAKIEGNMDAELYCKILDEDLIGTFEWFGMDKDKMIFQHDKDPKHTAKKTKTWLENEKIQVLDWPAQSPDLNPIEHLWDNLKRRLASYERQPSAIWELWERVQDEWNEISKEECTKLIESMPRRIAAVLKEKGGHTKY